MQGRKAIKLAKKLLREVRLGLFEIGTQQLRFVQASIFFQIDAEIGFCFF